MPKKHRIKLICEQCNQEFTRCPSQIKRPGQGRFCSCECMWESRRHGKRYTCDQCGLMFYRRAGEQSKNGPESKVFCSASCYQKARKTTMQSSTYLKKGGRHEHRIIAEKLLRRPLQRGEIVHHIDGNTHNNTPENLLVLPSQKDHARIHFSRKK